MEKSTGKHGFNIIDLLITAIIIVAAALMAYIFFFNKSSNSTANTIKVQYTLEIKNERDELVDNAAANVGKTLVEGTAKYNLGKVVDFYSDAAIYATHNMQDGSATYSEYPEHSNVYFIVEADAVKNAVTQRYSVNGFEISVGTLVYVRLPEYAGTAYCTGINEITE